MMKRLFLLLVCLVAPFAGLPLLSGLSQAADTGPALSSLWSAPGGLSTRPAAADWIQAHSQPVGEGCTPVEPLALPDTLPARSYRFTPPPPHTESRGRILYLQDPITEFFVVRGIDASGCRWQAGAGRGFPFAHREILSPFPNVKLPSLAPGTTLEILVIDRKSFRPWVKVVERPAFVRNSMLIWMGLAGYASVLLVIILVALSFDIRERNQRALAYVLYVLSLLVWTTQNFALGDAWLPAWPGPGAFPVMQAVAVALVAAGIGNAIIQFLDLDRTGRWLVSASVALSSLAFLSSAWFTQGYRVGAALLILLALSVTVLLLRRVRQLDLSMQLFTLGFIAIMVGGGVQAFSILHSGDQTSDLAAIAFPIGNLAQSILWLAALGVRNRNDRRALQERLVYDATHDMVTELPNRTLLNRRLQVCLDSVQRPPHPSFGLMFLDLDRFKVINDSLGHPVGDQLLQNFSRMLERICPSHCTIARFGGDEFLVLVEFPCSEGHVTEIARDILTHLQTPIKLGDRHIRINASIGIVLIDAGYTCVDAVMRDADTALYAAKHAGRGTYEVFVPQMRASAARRFELENDLANAIKHQQFSLYYQPIVDIETRQHAGFESLVRWHHPDKGTVSPDEFIPLAEETGLIREIGAMILHEAIRQVGDWKKAGIWRAGWYVSINVSGEQLQSASLLDEIRLLLDQHGLVPGDIRIELTETAVISNNEVADAVLPRLRDEGILLCMDDFGTGYSSLSYLSDLPFSVLKIDKSFVDNVVDRPEQRTLVRTILAMAETMQLKVIAEGIESEAQYGLLKEMHCGYGQGYLFNRPFPAESASQWLQAHLSDAARE